MMIERISPNARYAQAVRNSDTCYIAGQIADDFDADITVQTQQVLDKIDSLLAECGSDRTRLLSCTVWVRDFADYDAYNAVWEEWIGRSVPARASVGSVLLDPRLKIEIAAVAACDQPSTCSTTRVKDAAEQTPEIDARTLKSLQDQGGTLVLDIRDTSELASGTIPGSVHAQRGMLEFMLDRNSDSFIAEIADADRLVFVCGSGGRAALSAQLAKEMGWNAIRLTGGMKGWRAEFE